MVVTKNKMHILLTRQLEDCSDLIIRFQNLGHLVSHLPLLNFEKVLYDSKLIKDSMELFLQVQMQLNS